MQCWWFGWGNCVAHYNWSLWLCVMGADDLIALVTSRHKDQIICSHHTLSSPTHIVQTIQLECICRNIYWCFLPLGGAPNNITCQLNLVQIWSWSNWIVHSKIHSSGQCGQVMEVLYGSRQSDLYVLMLPGRSDCPLPLYTSITCPHCPLEWIFQVDYSIRVYLQEYILMFFTIGWSSK